MKLQVAMDVLTTAQALELAGAVTEHVDILELGTPLIKNAGLSAVQTIREAFPEKTIFADLKTMDAGELEANLAFEAGADLVSVLGLADDSTIAGAVKAAQAHEKGIVVDLIGVADKAERARQVTALGATFVEFHAGLDEQAQPGYNLESLLSAGEQAGVPFSVAGGVGVSTITSVQRSGADVAVAGSAIYSAEQPAEAARLLRESINLSVLS